MGCRKTKCYLGKINIVLFNSAQLKWYVYLTKWEQESMEECEHSYNSEIQTMFWVRRVVVVAVF